MEKNCAFQYFAENKMIEDTGLITEKEAESFWVKFKDHFTEQCERGDVAEMAIWCDMEFDGHYHKYFKHVHSRDVIIKDGVAYTMEPAF